MNLLYPKIAPQHWGTMLRYACGGALVAGAYGIAHDEITYTLSPEYFTRFKFEQFSQVDFGWPVRVHVAEIGFLATWWVGFIAVWFLARIAVQKWPPHIAKREIRRGVVLLLGCALLGAATGYLWGLRRGIESTAWQMMTLQYGVQDVRSFIRAAYIHNGSYLGGMVGLLMALVSLKGRSR